MTSLEAIKKFASEYEPVAGRALTNEDRALVEDAVIAYTCHEQWMILHPSTEAAVRRVDALATQAVAQKSHEGAEDLAMVKQTIIELQQILNRREHANAIMREHLATMSDELRKGS